MASKVLKDKVCPASLETRVPTVRTLKFTRPMQFYPSWRCYHTPKCATYVLVSVNSLSSMAAVVGVHWCRSEGPSQLLVPLLWRPISVLAPIFWVNGQSPTY